MHISVGSNDPEAGLGIHRQEAVVCELYKSASAVCQIEELLGFFCRAEGEETGSLSSCHNNNVSGHRTANIRNSVKNC